MSTPSPHVSILADLPHLPVTPSALGWTSQIGFGGMPQDRQCRIAARRAFVEMKQLFLRAVADLPGRKGQWLHTQVRQANEPMDLWLLRGPVLAMLRRDDDHTRDLRGALYRTLDSAFQDTNTLDSLVSLPPPEDLDS